MSHPETADQHDHETPPADRVVLSYPDELSDWGRDQIDSDRYRDYFRRTLGAVRAGDRREEFVDVGCCGDSLDVPFRVEQIVLEDVNPDETAGSRSDSEHSSTDSATVASVRSTTTIEFVEREAAIDGGWLVQSDAAPDDTCDIS